MARILVEHNADVDSQDNRKVSCLMAAFRKVSIMYMYIMNIDIEFCIIF